MTNDFDFSDDEPTQTIPHETLTEYGEKLRASQTGMPEPIATSERPTRNIRPARSQNITLILP